MAYAAVKSLQSSVIRLKSINNVDLISDAREELTLLEIDVSLMEAFVDPDQQAPINNEVILRIKKDLESLIADAVRKAEDAIDTCLSNNLAPLRIGCAKLSLISPKADQLEQVVRSLREQELRPMVISVKQFNYPNRHFGQVKKVPFATRTKVHPVWKESVNVGLRDEEDKLIGFLMEQRRNKLDVITLFGVCGIGKTTLAWSTYNSQKIQYEFPTRIWVNLSEGFYEHDKFLNILKQLSSDFSSSNNSLSDQQLLETIRARLEECKFLLVIDGVSSVKDWDAISNVFPHRNQMGKVLITTRSTEVSSHAYRMTRRLPFEMRQLSNSESWTLLQLKVYGHIDGCTPEVKDIGESIARQCEGIPLMIALVSGFLRAHLNALEQNNVDAAYAEWVKMHKRVSLFRFNSSASRILENAELVFHILPSELSDCFLYLGVFPEDYEIPAWTLIRLWIAEGFIYPKDDQSFEEAADGILEELIIRNLLTVDRVSANGQVKTCRVPNIMRTFCRSKASGQNLFEVMEDIGESLFYDNLPRRVIIYFDIELFLSIEWKIQFTRSILCFDKEPVQALNPEYISAIPDAFRLLRVLDSNKSIKFHQFPKGIIKLIHLRYITLSGDNLHVLPEAISQLWNLQTIVIDTMSRRLTVKANIWKMIMLRHLKTKASIILDIKYEDGECDQPCYHHQNLQTLTRLSPEYCTENVFGRASNLKKLVIFGKLSNLVDIKSLQKLKRLENLKLVNDFFYEHMQIDGLIQPNCFPTSLKNLTLSATFLKWEHMSTVLSKVETLEVLKLKENAFTGRFFNLIGDDRFCSLRFLMIGETNLVSWVASAEQFPVLECLVLKNCKKLGEIPVGLAKSLYKLDVDHLGKSAVESARKIEEEKRQLGCAFKLTVGPGCE